jgi:1-acyl-sn-glycerol-3-phosphate acyltransferase
MNLPIGPQVPRRGNAFSRFLGRTTLRLLGWKLAGTIPDLPRMVLIGAPHTTNFDGVISIATLIALGLDARIMIKDSAFKGPLGSFLRWAGAIPINRQVPKGVIEQSIEALTTGPGMLLLLAPEGTRSAAPE